MVHSESTEGLLAGVQSSNDIFQELHAFRFKSCSRNEGMVSGNVCNTWVALVLKLSKAVGISMDRS